MSAPSAPASSSSSLPSAIARGDTLIAGALAGLVAESLAHPLDTLSVRAKVHPQSAYGSLAGAAGLILRQEGPRGLMAGLSATVASSIPSAAAFWTSYEFLKTRLLERTGHQYVPLVHFVSGSLSEVFASLLVAPLEVAKARLQLGANPSRATGGLMPATENFPSLRATLAGVYRERGFRGLYAGWKAVLILDCCYSGTQFATFEFVKATLEGSSSGGGGGGAELDALPRGEVRGAEAGSALSVGQTLLAGCCAGAIAAVVTNPLDVVAVRTVVQSGGAAFGGTSFRGVIAAALAEGPVALWRGTLPRVAQMAPSAAIFFGVYETARALLGSGAQEGGEEEASLIAAAGMRGGSGGA